MKIYGDAEESPWSVNSHIPFLFCVICIFLLTSKYYMYNCKLYKEVRSLFKSELHRYFES